jgi:putative spermidine/putrescine transport system substrate-binding protein
MTHKTQISRRTLLKAAGGAAAAAAIGTPAVHAQTIVLKTTAWGGKWGEVMKGQIIPAFEKDFK